MNFQRANVALWLLLATSLVILCSLFVGVGVNTPHKRPPRTTQPTKTASKENSLTQEQKRAYGARLVTTVTTNSETRAVVDECRRTNRLLFIFMPGTTSAGKQEEAVIAEAAYNNKANVRFIKFEHNPNNPDGPLFRMPGIQDPPMMIVIDVRNDIWTVNSGCLDLGQIQNLIDTACR